jgi:hypothetical protein
MTVPPWATQDLAQETTLFCDLPGAAADEWKTLLCAESNSLIP